MPPDSKIKFVSQHDERLPADWRERSCGIAALAMVIGYYLNGNAELATVEKIWAKGLELDAYMPNVGWKHKELALVAKSYNLEAYNRDLALLNDPEKAWQEFLLDLEGGPLVVSVYKDFSANKTAASHLIVIEKIADDMVHVLDPDEKDETAGNYTIHTTTLRRGWKQRYLVVKYRNVCSGGN